MNTPRYRVRAPEFRVMPLVPAAPLVSQMDESVGCPPDNGKTGQIGNQPVNATHEKATCRHAKRDNYNDQIRRVAGDGQGRPSEAGGAMQASGDAARASAEAVICSCGSMVVPGREPRNDLISHTP